MECGIDLARTFHTNFVPDGSPRAHHPDASNVSQQTPPSAREHEGAPTAGVLVFDAESLRSVISPLIAPPLLGGRFASTSKPANPKAREIAEVVRSIIDSLGESSGKAQGLKGPITTTAKVSNSDNRIYIRVHGTTALGILKVGRKRLFIGDVDAGCEYRKGNMKEVTPLCVLDFFVHVGRQRSGHGKALFDVMLSTEGVKPCSLGYDRPSPKLINFLNRHYSLRTYHMQANNFCLFSKFFESQNGSVGPRGPAVAPRTRSGPFGSPTAESTPSPAPANRPSAFGGPHRSSTAFGSSQGIDASVESSPSAATVSHPGVGCPPSSGGGRAAVYGGAFNTRSPIPSDPGFAEGDPGRPTLAAESRTLCDDGTCLTGSRRAKGGERASEVITAAALIYGGDMASSISPTADATPQGRTGSDGCRSVAARDGRGRKDDSCGIAQAPKVVPGFPGEEGGKRTSPATSGVSASPGVGGMIPPKGGGGSVMKLGGMQSIGLDGLHRSSAMYSHGGYAERLMKLEMSRRDVSKLKGQV